MKNKLIKSHFTLPISRLRRELNKWIRWIDGNSDGELFITRNRIVIAIMVSPSYYKILKTCNPKKKN